MKNRALLENYGLSGDLECPIGDYVNDDDNQQYHEGLNVTPIDAHYRRVKST